MIKGTKLGQSKCFPKPCRQEPTTPLAQCAFLCYFIQAKKNINFLWAHNISIIQGIVQTVLSY